MNAARLIVTSAVVVAAIAAIGQSTSTSSSQSKNGGASASASSSSSYRSFGQGGNQAFGNQVLGNLPRPTHVVNYRFSDRSPGANISVRHVDAVLYERENQFWSNLARNGKLVMAGFWREKDGAMAVLSARDDREAMQLLQSDPTIRQGAAYEVRAWEPSVTTQGIPAQAVGSQNNTSENGSSQSSGQQSGSQQSGGRQLRSSGR